MGQEFFELEQQIYSSKKYQTWHTNLKLWRKFSQLLQTDPLFRS